MLKRSIFLQNNTKKRIWLLSCIGSQHQQSCCDIEALDAWLASPVNGSQNKEGRMPERCQNNEGRKPERWQQQHRLHLKLQVASKTVLDISQMDGDWHRTEADHGSILTKGKLIRLCWVAARQARVDMTADKSLPFKTSESPKAILNNTSSNATFCHWALPTCWSKCVANCVGTAAVQGAIMQTATDGTKKNVVMMSTTHFQTASCWLQMSLQ